MKKFVLLAMFFVFVASVSAYEECKGTMFPTDVPCHLFLPNNVSETPCNTLNVSFYNVSTLLYVQNMSDYNDFTCNGTFNRTDLGTYTFFYLSGDSGSVILTEDRDNRFYLNVVFVLFLLTLIGLGYYLEDPTFTTIAGFMAGIFALDIFLNGFPGLNNDFLRNTISIVIAGLGFYLVLIPWIDKWEKGDI